MAVRLVHDDEHMILCLEVSGIIDPGEAFGEFAREMHRLDRSRTRYLLLDLSALEADIPLEGLSAFVDDAAPVLKRFGAARTALVISRRMQIASLAASMLFNAGIQLALFESRGDATIWLLA